MDSDSNHPMRVYEPGSTLRNPAQFFSTIIEDLRSCWELGWQLFTRDLKAQYRQSLLGYFWAFAPPIFNASIFIFLRSSGAVRIDDPGVPYPLFVMSGTLIWQCLVEAIVGPGMALNKSKSFLAKVNFPRESIILSAVWLLLFNSSIRLLIIAAVMVAYGVPLTLEALWFPVSFFGLLVFGLGLGIMLCIVGSLYTDITKGLPMLMQVMIYLSPVVYPPSTTGLVGVISAWNPLSPFLISSRQALLAQEQTHLQAIMILLPISIALFIFSWLSFKTVMPRLIERMPS